MLGPSLRIQKNESTRYKIQETLYNVGFHKQITLATRAISPLGINRLPCRSKIRPKSGFSVMSHS